MSVDEIRYGGDVEVWPRLSLLEATRRYDVVNDIRIRYDVVKTCPWSSLLKMDDMMFVDAIKNEVI